MNKIEKEREWDLPTHLSRRQIRFRLFRIRQGNDEGQDDLKEYIQSQFRGPMNWDSFTFTWDVGVKDPLKVITEDQWVDHGGSYESLSGAKYPAAFTHQEK